MNRLVQRFGSQGLTVIGLSKGATQETRDFVREVGIRYPVYITDFKRAPKPLSQTQVIPSLFLVDRKGRLIWQRAGLVYGQEMRDLEQRLHKLLAATGKAKSPPRR